MRQNTRRRNLWFAGLILTVVMLSGCTEKVLDSPPAGGKNVVLKARVTSAALLQYVDSFRLTVTGRDMSTITAVLGYADGHIEGEIEVPVGENRTFVLEAIDSGRLEDSVIYRGRTTRSVLPGVVTVLEIEMRPVVPMVKLSPQWSEARAGQMFEIEIKAYNIQNLRGVWVWIDFEYNNRFVEPLGAVPSGSLGASVLFDSRYVYDGLFYEVVILDTAGRAIVDNEGNGTLARVQFTGDVALTATLSFSQMSLQDVQGDSIPTSGIFQEVAQVHVQPLTETVVTFPDANLEAAVRDAMDYPTGDIMLSQVLVLQYLSAWDYYNPISDLTGIERLCNLRSLYLGDHNITDIAPLAELHKLHDLNIRGNSIADLGPLAGLTGLGVLRAGYNDISNLSPLGGLTSLYTLDLSGNQIAGVEPLAALEDLRELYIRDASITDVTPLSGLSDLYYLDLSYNSQLSDVSALAGLLGLYSLTLTDNAITDIYPLVQNAQSGGLGSGDYLYLSRNPLSSTSTIVYIPQLRQYGVTVIY